MRIVSEKRRGAIDYRFNPSKGRAWGGAMNGQALRCRLFSELILKADPQAIVETGTYLGTTTEWMSAFQIPIYSCEASDRNYGFSMARLATIPNIHLVQADSRQALRDLVSGPLCEQLGSNVLFYLDAHWNNDLPLAEEMDIIFDHFERPIVMVDDFQVPGDAGYYFDDYGDGKALDAAYTAESVDRNDLAVFYPSYPSSDETGARRGCAVFVRREGLAPLMRSMSFLRSALDDSRSSHNA